jgi:hypothetical protein
MILKEAVPVQHPHEHDAPAENPNTLSRPPHVLHTADTSRSLSLSLSLSLILCFLCSAWPDRL